MRKVFVGVLSAVMVLLVGTTSALAACSGARGCYVDADRDGVCDYFNGCCNYVDMDEDGICDYCGAYHRISMDGIGQDQYFVDADGDGICDSYLAGQTRERRSGHHSHGRHCR